MFFQRASILTRIPKIPEPQDCIFQHSLRLALLVDIMQNGIFVGWKWITVSSSIFSNCFFLSSVNNYWGWRIEDLVEDVGLHPLGMVERGSRRRCLKKDLGYWWGNNSKQLASPRGWVHFQELHLKTGLAALGHHLLWCSIFQVKFQTNHVSLSFVFKRISCITEG